MLFFDEFPTDNQLRRAPELATLAILDTALHMTLQAIFAVHPDVNWENCPASIIFSHQRQLFLPIG
ncbi:MAG: hypothetical protein FJZ01_28705 [Candidatus Sericytochromatia bacterium]|nr:hypothetical protein [Candidatus Tanganyikabacteria bacterium]